MDSRLHGNDDGRIGCHSEERNDEESKATLDPCGYLRDGPTRETRLGSLEPSSGTETFVWSAFPTSDAIPFTTSSTRTVHDKAEAIYTDELASYLGIADNDTRHETVNHFVEQWILGVVHTNSIEGVWALFKRIIVEAFHKVSANHLDRYLEELDGGTTTGATTISSLTPFAVLLTLSILLIRSWLPNGLKESRSSKVIVSDHHC